MVLECQENNNKQQSPPHHNESAIRNAMQMGWWETTRNLFPKYSGQTWCHNTKSAVPLETCKPLMTVASKAYSDLLCKCPSYAMVTTTGENKYNWPPRILCWMVALQKTPNQYQICCHQSITYYNKKHVLADSYRSTSLKYAKKIAMVKSVVKCHEGLEVHCHYHLNINMDCLYYILWWSWIFHGRRPWLMLAPQSCQVESQSNADKEHIIFQHVM